MSVEATGLLSAQARIVAIQGRFATGRTAVVASGAAAAVQPRPASFDSAMAKALAQAPGAAPSADVGSAGVAGVDPAGAADGDLGGRAVAAARAYLGVPYLWGGTDPAKGLDCSGLVQRAYGDVGVSLPRVAADQARAGQPVADLAHARPGDLVAFGDPVDHIGIYVGDGRMLVAPRSGEEVRVQAVYRTPSAIRRISAAAESTPWLAQTLATAAATRGAQVAATCSGNRAPAGATGSGAFEELFARAGRRHGIPAALLRAVARAESGFDPAAVSPAGATGLMQLMPATARELGVDPRDPAQAVEGAARLLAGHLARFGSVPLALAAYNAGPAAVERHGGVPPYPETQAYVRRILTDLEAS